MLPTEYSSSVQPKVSSPNANLRNGLGGGRPPGAISRCGGGSGSAGPHVRQELGVAQVPLVHLEQHGGRAYEARRDTTGWDGIGLTSFVASSLLSLRGVLVERMCAPLLPAYRGMM